VYTYGLVLQVDMTADLTDREATKAQQGLGKEIRKKFEPIIHAFMI
jgi:hypothetical protein